MGIRKATARNACAARCQLTFTGSNRLGRTLTEPRVQRTDRRTRRRASAPDLPSGCTVGASEVLDTSLRPEQRTACGVCVRGRALLPHLSSASLPGRQLPHRSAGAIQCSDPGSEPIRGGAAPKPKEWL